MTLLTIQDAADYLKMSTGYVKLAIRKGELKVARFGRMCYIAFQLGLDVSGSVYVGLFSRALVPASTADEVIPPDLPNLKNAHMGVEF